MKKIYKCHEVASYASTRKLPLHHQTSMRSHSVRRVLSAAGKSAICSCNVDRCFNKFVSFMWTVLSSASSVASARRASTILAAAIAFASVSSRTWWSSARRLACGSTGGNFCPTDGCCCSGGCPADGYC